MATRQSFGKTWWGEQWLNALTQIDYDNRLPRGRSYANKGAVKDLQINAGTIKANVQGSRPKPYQVVIQAPAIAKADTVRLLDDVIQDPVLIARLLNRELDPAMLEKAKSLGLSLFPARWRDLKMTCSCPDWAVPCKHLAAVIYLLSREIDGNPFLVFSLRGIDLVQALKTRNIHIEKEAVGTLPQIAVEWPAASVIDVGEATDGSGWEFIDFSTLPALSATLLQILSPQPSFSASEDFRETLRRVLDRVSKTARRVLTQTATDEQSTQPALLAADCPVVVLNSDYTTSIANAKHISDVGALLDALAELDAAQLPDFQPAVAALFQLRQTALHLLAQGAVVPRLFAGRNTAVELRWFPATLDKTVRDLMQRIAAVLPSGLVQWQRGKARLPMELAAQANCVCSLFLDQFIHRWSDIDSGKGAVNKSRRLFFSTGAANYNGPGEGSMAASIQAWLSRLHLVNKEFFPVLCLDKANTRTADFALTLAVENSTLDLEKPVPLHDVLTLPAWSNSRYSILQTVSLLAEFFPPLNHYVSLGARAPVAIAAQELPALLFDTLPILRFLGMRVLLPKALDQLRRPRLSMQIKGNAADSLHFLSVDDVLTFDWKVAVGDHLLTRAEFEKLLQSATSVVRFKGEYVYLDAREIEQLRAQLDKPPVLAGSELLRVALATEFAGATVALDKAAQRMIQKLTDVAEIALPKGLQATLRPYQQRGYAWLYRNTRIGFGSVIADDMGLGKTVQVIAAILKLKEEKALQTAKVLVMVPTTLLTNWQKELARFAPGLSVGIFHGAKRELTTRRPDVLLTTLGVARSAAAALKALAWQLVVVDEAQNIKNPTSAQTRAAKSIPAQSFIAMSGTPVENRLSEYWSIMDFANRGYLGNLTQFVRDYAKPIQTQHDQVVIERFKRVTAPFLLRRLKSDKSIISDLPDKIEQDQYCSLGESQAALYQSVVDAGLRTIAGATDTFKRQGLVLQMILALKQVCNHPFHYLKQGVKPAGDDALASGKIDRLFELLDEMHASHEKVLIFTQFREMGDLLSGWLQQRYGREPLFLHGGVSRARRDAMVERFQHDRTERIFILSLKAGGTGLNLTAASNVIHYDLWWNPAVEAQATDRAYRIGQQRNVQVHRLITRATFEERINDMIRSKKQLADLTVGVGEQWIGHLSTGELKDLFAYGG